jgi:hypothetical protein
MSPDLGPGIVTFSVIYAVVGELPWCDPAVWQQRAGSNYYAALGDNNKAFVPTTLIWTGARFLHSIQSLTHEEQMQKANVYFRQSDEIVVPGSNSS